MWRHSSCCSRKQRGNLDCDTIVARNCRSQHCGRRSSALRQMPCLLPQSCAPVGSGLPAGRCENRSANYRLPSANNGVLQRFVVIALWFAATVVMADASVLSSELSRSNAAYQRSVVRQRGMLHTAQHNSIATPFLYSHAVRGFVFSWPVHRKRNAAATTEFCQFSSICCSPRNQPLSS